MKAIKVVCLFFTLLLAFSIDGYSHGEIQNKNRCSWGWKYKAIARVNNGPGIRRQSQRGCGGNYFASVSYPCVWQQTRNNWGYGTYSGAVTATTWLCGRGIPNSQLFYDLNLPKEALNQEVYEESHLEHNPIEFSEREILIPNLNGHMYTNGEEVFSSFEIIVWKPVHDLSNDMEDTVATQSKTLWQGKIELINGEVKVSGKFPKEAFQIVLDNTKPKGGYKVIFNNETITAELPTGVNGFEDEIIVSIISDGGTREDNILNNVENETLNESTITFETYPNPISNILNIKFTAQSKGQGTIKLYNSAGQLISTVYDGQFAMENSFTYNFREKNLDTGMYYILILIEKEQYLKKVIYKN